MKNFNLTRIDMIVEEKIKPNLLRIYEMKVEGHSDKQIARWLGISEVDFVKAKERSEVVRDTYEEAMDVLKSKLRAVVIRRALGTDGKIDKNGEEVGADANLAFRILEKIDNEFKGKSFEIGSGITIENIIMQVVGAREAKRDVEVVDVEDFGDDVLGVDEL